jgi:hypothetical protein
MMRSKARNAGPACFISRFIHIEVEASRLSVTWSFTPEVEASSRPKISPSVNIRSGSSIQSPWLWPFFMRKRTAVASSERKSPTSMFDSCSEASSSRRRARSNCAESRLPAELPLMSPCAMCLLLGCCEVN